VINRATGHGVSIRLSSMCAEDQSLSITSTFVVDRPRIARESQGSRKEGKENRTIRLRERIAMWVTSHECVEQAPHERLS
jgi:hypothetical protein